MDHEKIYLQGFYPRSLVSAFVNILLLKCSCILPRLDTSKILILKLVSVVDQATLTLTLVETKKIGFLLSWPYPNLL